MISDKLDHFRPRIRKYRQEFPISGDSSRDLHLSSCCQVGIHIELEFRSQNVAVLILKTSKRGST